MSKFVIRRSNRIPEEIEQFRPLHKSSIMWPDIFRVLSMLTRLRNISCLSSE